MKRNSALFLGYLMNVSLNAIFAVMHTATVIACIPFIDTLVQYKQVLCLRYV